MSSKIQTDKKLHVDEIKKAHIKNEKNIKNDKDKNVRENLTVIIAPENLKAIQDHKVGWQYRYRVNNFVEKLKSTPNLSIKDNKVNIERVNESNEEQNETSVYNGPKPKVGWQNRYRISKFINAGGNVNNTIVLEKSDLKKEEKNIVNDKIKENEEATIQLGRFKVDKTKIGEIGSKHKYRATNKVKKLIFDNNKPRRTQTANKIKNLKELPIVEVVEFTENKEIPFCEDFRVEGEDLSVVLIDLIKPQEKIEETEKFNSEENLIKQKVGFEHRYRISRMLSNEQGDKETQVIDPILPVQEKFNAESKPKVGFEHRYRVSRMLADISIDDFKGSKEKPSDKKAIKSNKEDSLDKTYESNMKPKVGFEYR
jgi:hypothetical protein